METYVEGDVSKAHLDVAIHGGAAWRVAHDPRDLAPTPVASQTTGGRSGAAHGGPGALSMATLAATRCNAVIHAHFTQLRERGKAFKVAMVACMHKLLTILNAMMMNRTPWQPIGPSTGGGNAVESSSGRKAAAVLPT